MDQVGIDLAPLAVGRNLPVDRLHIEINRQFHRLTRAGNAACYVPRGYDLYIER